MAPTHVGELHLGQPVHTLPSANRHSPGAIVGSADTSQLLKISITPWDISQDLKTAPEPSKQTLASGQLIKTLNSAHRNDPRQLYDGRQASVSVQGPRTPPVLFSGDASDALRHHRRVPGLQKALRASLAAATGPRPPSQASRPCGVPGGP